jgi:hypothetical protein
MKRHVRNALISGLLVSAAFPAAAFSPRSAERYVEAPRYRSSLQASSDKECPEAKAARRSGAATERSRLAWLDVLSWLGLEGLRG